MSKRFNVFGLGNAIVDLQLQVTETELEQLGCASEKATMRLVEREEQHGLIGSLRDRKARQSSGGSLANSMIALAQLGGKASFAGLVGDDELGRFYTDEMKELGIALEIAPNGTLPTGTSAVLITPDAERTMRTYLGASALFSEKDVVEELLADSSYIFIEGYLFAQEGGRAAVQRAVSLAKKHGVKIAVTVSDAFIVDVFGDSFRPVVEQADMLFANAVEGKKLAGTEDEEVAFAALKKLVPNVAYTRSSKGAWVSLHGEETRVDAYSVKAIDDTGAGDMFAGAFLYGALHGFSAEKTARLACFLASRVVSQFGARLQGDVQRLVQEAEIL